MIEWEAPSGDFILDMKTYVANTKYTGLQDETKGMEVFIHESIAPSFCGYLASQKPTMNEHIDGESHPDWDGWQSRGWSIIHVNLKDALSTMVKGTEVYTIEVNGMIAAKTPHKHAMLKYLDLLESFFDAINIEIDNEY